MLGLLREKHILPAFKHEVNKLILLGS